MIEAFKIAALLNLEGNSFTKLKELMALLKKTQREFKNLNALTKALNVNLSEGRFSDPFRRLNQSLAVTERRMSAVVMQSRALNRTMESGSVGNAVEEGAIAGAASKGASRARRRGKFHHHARSHFDIGGMGITNNVPLGVGIGAGLVAGGAYEAYQAGSEWSRQVARVRMQGFTGSEVNQAKAYAMNTRIPGISHIEMMEAIRDSAMATKSMPMALKLAKPMAEIQYANSIIYHKQYTGSQSSALIKYAEARGGGDLNKTVGALNEAQKLISLSGGNFDPIQLRAMMRHGALALQHVSSLGMAGLEPVAQEVQGATVGTGLQSLSLELLGGHIYKKSAANLVRSGFGKWGKSGFELKRKWKNLLMTDPAEFAFGVHDTLKERGYSEKQITEFETRNFVRTGGILVSLLNKNRSKIMRTRELYSTAFGINASVSEAGGMPGGQMKNLSAAFQDFSTALWNLSKPGIIDGIKALTFLLNQLTNALTFLKKHNILPGAGKTLGMAASSVIPGAQGLYLEHDLYNKVISHFEKPKTNDSVHVHFDPHEFQHAVASGLNTAATKQPTTITGINSFETRFTSPFNGNGGF